MLHPKDIAYFERFHNRTIYTLGGSAMMEVHVRSLLQTAFTVSQAVGRAREEIRECFRNPAESN